MIYLFLDVQLNWWPCHRVIVQSFLTYKEQPKRPVTFETFDQSDEETRPVQQKDNDKDNYNDNKNDNDNDKDNAKDI